MVTNTEINPNVVYIFNPAYILKNDVNRILITNTAGKFLDKPGEITDGFVNFVHPLHAILFSYFDGLNKIEEIINEVSESFEMPLEKTREIVAQFIENPNTLTVIHEQIPFSFPKNVLIPKSNDILVREFNINDFIIPAENAVYDNVRLNKPLDTIFMINTLCETDCIYCYADRKKNINCQISIERIKELIAEAKSLEMRNFDLCGGELFLYKHWEELLSTLYNNGFFPYVSTKIPITENTIQRLKNIGVDSIQISIDSIQGNELQQILKVNSAYAEKMKNTLLTLDRYDFKIYVNSIITNYNSNVSYVDELLDFLFSLKNIKRVGVSAAGYSLYKTENDFLKYRPTLDSIKKIEELINNKKAKQTLNLFFGGYLSQNDFNQPKETFDKRALCTGNVENFYILPDGKVTICEELYWHPKFIIGDVTKQSIMECWNSPEAQSLYRLDQKMISDKSPCKTCHEFDKCRNLPGVCWKQVMYAYGNNNWDFPDPRCPLAPKEINQILIQ